MINPTGLKIRYDAMGSGYYGARRGTRRHKGEDRLVMPGSYVYAPICGKVIKFNDAYGDGEYKGITIQGDNLTVKLLYLEPTKILLYRFVEQGEHIGIAQDISLKYGKEMKPHIHIEVVSCNPQFLYSINGDKVLYGNKDLYAGKE